jgi:hypothetical protein
MADLFKVRVEDVQDRLHHLTLEERVKESGTRPDCWLIIPHSDSRNPEKRPNRQ